MGLFDVFRKKSADPQMVDRELAQKIVHLVMNMLRDKDGRIHTEDAISACATIVAERCIDAAGDFSLRDHDMTPGSRVFSDKANQLICADVPYSDPTMFPPTCIAGMLRTFLPTSIYSNADFPSVEEVIKYFVANIGKPEDWGKVPLSNPEHLPFIPPLQFGYDSRPVVDGILQAAGPDKMRHLTIATMALAEMLKLVEASMAHKATLTLALETVNGMAKNAPMTAKAMNRVQQEYQRQKP